MFLKENLNCLTLNHFFAIFITNPLRLFEPLTANLLLPYCQVPDRPFFIFGH